MSTNPFTLHTAPTSNDVAPPIPMTFLVPSIESSVRDLGSNLVAGRIGEVFAELQRLRELVRQLRERVEEDAVDSSLSTGGTNDGT